ncbi:NAD-binding protein [Aquihabitans sp. G128]|uniref:NAD-binding protein n=1 Tax=Aquihabitans sp. G128 TaxID=2849779 RepID=UPI001C228819|nr:NAD-binding protein [Aquihabitans sp. G128]QXC59690.1 NAD-binding protein [Aquihabitans sp. G128]
MKVLRAAWSPKWRWLTLTLAWVGVASLAMWGLARGKPQSSIWNRLYSLPDFFSISISDDTADLDWRIQLARFLGPLAFASTFYAATATVLRSQLDRLRLRFAKDHVIVAGLGDKGSRLAMSFAAAGRKVVAIEPDPANPNVASVARRGVTVLAGPATDPQVLAEAGVARASDLVVVADDASNAEIVAVASHVVRKPGDPALRASVHLIDPQLSRLLRTRELSAGTASVRLDFFNIFQRGARLWLAETDPLAVRHDGRPPHVVVLGVGSLGESVAVVVAQRFAEQATEGDEPLRLTLVDPDAAARYRSLRLRHPALVAHTSAEAIDLDPDRPVPDAAEAFRELLADGSVTAAFVCHDDDTEALSTALFVRLALGSTDALVTVRTRSEAGLALLVDEVEAGGVGGIHGFPLFDRTCSADAIDGGTNESVARALHEDYVARAGAAGQESSSVVGWTELDAGTKESNRRAADGLVAALASVGCGLAPLYGWDGAGFAFTDDEVEQLARGEHERWSDDRRRSGWTHAAERDDARKHHPLLVAWDELPEAERQKNRDAALQLPAVLARAGFQLVHLPTRTPT